MCCCFGDVCVCVICVVLILCTFRDCVSCLLVSGTNGRTGCQQKSCWLGQASWISMNTTSFAFGLYGGIIFRTKSSNLWLKQMFVQSKNKSLSIKKWLICTAYFAIKDLNNIRGIPIYKAPLTCHNIIYFTLSPIFDSLKVCHNTGNGIN